MHRVRTMVDLIGAGAMGLAFHQIVQLGPYEATILLGRCIQAVIVAMQGYI